MTKTVYVLGAGASAVAKLPTQNGLFKSIFKSDDYFKQMFTSDSFMKVNKTGLITLRAFDNFNACRQIVCDFIIENFSTNIFKSQYNLLIKKTYIDSVRKFVSSLFETELGKTDSIKWAIEYEENYSTWQSIFKNVCETCISLEDVFTICDKSVNEDSSFRNYTVSQIKNVRDSLSKCIIYTMCFHISYKTDPNNALNNLAKEIIQKRTACKLDEDPVSIISMNWDTLIDSYIYNTCQQLEREQSSYKVCADYCFHNYPLDGSIVSTLAKSNNIFNIKLVKLHGSINWVKCSNCAKIYTHFENNISLESLLTSDKEIKCQFCEKNSYRYCLEPIIITPTLLKSIDTTQLKNVWHNAQIELSEADEIIFIGYSFPIADFEFRYILKRSVNYFCKIKVILIKDDCPKYLKSLIKETKDLDSLKLIEKNLYYNSAESRFRDFFKTNEISFNYGGLQ